MASLTRRRVPPAFRLPPVANDAAAPAAHRTVAAAASRELDIPVRQHCCQSRIEYDLVLQQHGMSPPEWMASLGYLSPRSLLPRR